MSRKARWINKRRRLPQSVTLIFLASSGLLPWTNVDAFVGKASSSSFLSLRLESTECTYRDNRRETRHTVLNTVRKSKEDEEIKETLSPLGTTTVEAVVNASSSIVGKEEEDNKSCTRFASPLLEFGYLPAVKELEEGTTCTKPLLLYLPGFDGTYLSAFFQYPELHSIFDVRCLVSTMEDRSTFDELQQSILEFLAKEALKKDGALKEDVKQEMSTSIDEFPKKQQQQDEGLKGKTSFATFLSGILNQPKQRPSSSTKNTIDRPVYLVGESFGGILAAEVALALLEDNAKRGNKAINFQGLVLINAATCYDRSRLSVEGPPVARLPKLLYVFGILKLLPMFLDKISLPQLLAIIQGNALPSLIDNPIREAYMGRFALALPSLLKFMPQETFQWRLEQWLEIGCQRMETTLSQLANRAAGSGLRTLIVAGENDLTLPSIAEAERLAQILPNSHVHVVPAVGHANTCGTCLDLAAEMRSHFPELQSQLPEQRGRTAMKEVASQGEGIYYGMEPRYDGNKIGLSPLKYWSKEYYRKVEMPP